MKNIYLFFKSFFIVTRWFWICTISVLIEILIFTWIFLAEIPQKYLVLAPLVIFGPMLIGLIGTLIYFGLSILYGKVKDEYNQQNSK